MHHPLFFLMPVTVHKAIIRAFQEYKIDKTSVKRSALLSNQIFRNPKNIIIQMDNQTFTSLSRHNVTIFLSDADFRTFICTSDIDKLACIFYIWNNFR